MRPPILTKEQIMGLAYKSLTFIPFSIGIKGDRDLHIRNTIIRSCGYIVYLSIVRCQTWLIQTNVKVYIKNLAFTYLLWSKMIMHNTRIKSLIKWLISHILSVYCNLDTYNSCLVINLSSVISQISNSEIEYLISLKIVMLAIM